MSVQLSTYGVIKFTFLKQGSKQKFDRIDIVVFNIAYDFFHDSNGGNLIKEKETLLNYKATISKECHTLIAQNLLSQ